MKRSYVKVFIGFITALILGHGITMAQGNSLSFKASELQKIAEDYTGSTQNWPLVISLADHDTEENVFSITPSQVQELQNFSQIHASIAAQKERIGTLIADGATVFAAEEYQEVQKLMSAYTKAINDGNIEQAFSLGRNLPSAVDSMESALNENRVVDVQAQLSQKKGQVDKRLGLLGSWTDAMRGDLFEQSDGIRTFSESYALLSFVDGSDIQVEPNTMAVIRKSRIDRLNNSTDTEITLEDGGLLAKLSASGKEQSRYILNAGSSVSELQTQNFYAETEESGLVKLTNYDGQAIVNSNNVTVTIRQNEGTVVERGKSPMEPVKLLPSPEITWATSDSVVSDQAVVISFIPIDGAVSYRIQHSTDSKFEDNVNEVRMTDTSLAFNTLPMGITYVRVQAIDHLGLRGPFSETIRIIRSIDKVPPPIFIDNLNNDLLFAVNGQLDVEGATEPEARLTLNNERISVQSTGRFSYQTQINDKEKTFDLKATDPSGNTTQRSLRVVNMTKERVFDIRVRSASGSDLTPIRSGSTTFSGNLYPGIEVVLSNNTSERSVKTDFNGNWAVTLTLETGDLEISFKDSRTGEIYFSNSYSVQ
ncbi:hypothetical protein [Gracilimonas amylolytica]|uniref:hypothetical protein n=1 Tax=Gracilimonas amylolytica TaxID=1749045 RepID=UPI000CD97007|nr:hypothetical protein [Gracilimonas amylolytica]